MFILPDWLTPYYSKALKLCENVDLINDVNFCNNFYQIEVHESNSSKTCFLQFSSHDLLPDSFCSCSSSESGCVHLAAACLLSYRNGSFLHNAFLKSFWNKLSYFLFLELGASPFEQDLVKKSFTMKSPLCEVLVKSETEEGYKKILSLFIKEQETPKTSIKFSNLSEEVINRWEQGFIEPSLGYLLSPWYDLAKMLFLSQDQSFFSIRENIDKKPTKLELHNKDFGVFFSFPSEKFWSNELVTALETLHSKIKILPELKEISKITFSNNPTSLILEKKFLPLSEECLKEALTISSEIRYVPHQGFIINKESKETIDSQYIITTIISKKDFLPKKELLHDSVFHLKYHLYFDKDNTLHCEPYMFEKGDLIYGKVIDNKLVHLENKGLFLLKKSSIPTHNFSIKKEHLDDFIENNQTFLNEIPGFHISNTSLQEQLSFTVYFDGSLLFHNENNLDENLEINFGKWNYTPNKGFYLKQEKNLPFSETIISPNNVGSFIDAHYEFLCSINNFFSNQTCLTQILLQINKNDDSTLSIEPVFLNNNEQITNFVFVFEKYIFIEEKGFSPLPESINIPYNYIRKQTLEGHDIINFYSTIYPKIKDNIISNDPSLQTYSTINFELEELIKTTDGKYRLLLVLKVPELKSKLLFSDLLKELLKKKLFFFSPIGFLNFQEPFFQFLNYLINNSKTLVVSHSNNMLDISIMDFLKLDALKNISLSPKIKKNTDAELIFNNIKNFCLPHVPELENQSYTLRPYQKNGLLWLWFLYHNGLSGLLCDEMGLGKTHQAIALITTIQHRNKTPFLFLITAPTSVIPHWIEMIEKYASSLPLYHILNKSSLLPKDNYGVVLISYGVLRQNYDYINKLNLEIAIFDEIQAAKNHKSKLHNILCKINAKMKLGLTGTPIENNLYELKALFDIILPNYMPSTGTFNNLFIKQNNQQERKLLKIIRPFVLRRTKESVLPDLPPKINSELYCSLSSEQQSLYFNLLKEKESVINQLNSSNPTPYIHIFSLLNHLKQICCHPAVFLKTPENYKKHQSGKWNVFTELLEELLENNKKVVIFSQYLSMLKIIKIHLEENNISFALIKGGSKNRDKEIKKFQGDSSCRIFLGSLLASGTGINLTKAEAVIMYDRWWNPAKENQAFDRVHRIGQNKTVFNYKIITQNTIEEKIDLLIKKKNNLFIDNLPKDNLAFHLQKEDLLTILSYEKNQDDELKNL